MIWPMRIRFRDNLTIALLSYFVKRNGEKESAYP